MSKLWHADLLKAKVSIGHVAAGDTVWWHPDLVHGVDDVHDGTCAANVLYIPAAPMCVKNARYLSKQRDCLIAAITPPDFPTVRTQPFSIEPHELSTVARQQLGLDRSQPQTYATATSGVIPRATT